MIKKKRRKGIETWREEIGKVINQIRGHSVINKERGRRGNRRSTAK